MVAALTYMPPLMVVRSVSVIHHSLQEVPSCCLIRSACNFELNGRLTAFQ